MNDINLLPEELKPSRSVIKFSSGLNKIALLGVTTLLIVLVLAVSVYFFFSYMLSTSYKNQESLHGQIKAMEKTEQRLVLLKDRMAKIAVVYKEPKANDEVERLDSLTPMFPQGILVEGVSMEENDLKVAVSSPVLDNISKYIASVVTSGKFKKINLVSLAFDPGKGYVVELSFPE